MKNFRGLLLLVSSVFLLEYACYQVAKYFYHTDFPVFYCAGKIILDYEVSNQMIYNIDALTSCSVPEMLTDEYKGRFFFIYSIPAAYLISPLALLPYFQAKTLLITLSISSYLTSVYCLLKKISSTNVVSSKYLFLTAFWTPLLGDIVYAQINSILLLLICLATISANQRPYLAGAILGIVCLFKLFPLGLAFFLGLKNWRIFAACLLLIGVSVITFESQDWFMAISNITKNGATPIYKLLTYNLFYYIFYAFLISSITSLVILYAKLTDYFIISLAIPTLFLVMPIVEYHHLVLLIFPIIYLVLHSSQGNLEKGVLFISILLIIISKAFEHGTQKELVYFSCISLWLLLLIKGIKNNFLIKNKI